MRELIVNARTFARSATMSTDSYETNALAKAVLALCDAFEQSLEIERERAVHTPETK